LKSAEAADVMHRLLAKADVFVQNLAPGAAARLGLGAEALRAKYPRLIVCDISGYGNDGPHRDRKAYDLLIQAEAGFLSVTGQPDEPAKAGSSIADIAAGMYAYSSILSALLPRERTGEGSAIDVSMLEALAEWMGFPMYYAFDGAPPPPRAGASHASIYPYGPFAAGDGGVVMLGIQNEREWQAFCVQVLLDESLTRDARFASNAGRNTHRDALEARILAAFATLSTGQLQDRLDQAGIANARVNDMAGLWAHPQLAARGRWTDIDTPAGRVPALRPPGVNSAYTPRMDRVPAVGEHTAAVLAELGLPSDQIEKLMNAPRPDASR
jgi:crotonobetainyl-CoA:carnitine CoA-transferase CaiB-like acyl-CoA transferase